jgi:hypothetical protein
VTYNFKDINTNSFLNSEDSALITVQGKPYIFDSQTDRVDLHIYTLEEVLLTSVVDFKDFKQLDGDTVELNPENDLKTYGYENGDVILVYNYLRNLGTSRDSINYLFITQISNDRTELKCDFISADVDVEGFVRDVTGLLFTEEGIPSEIVLNFNENILVDITNITVYEEGSRSFIALKLYEPLPDQIDVRDTFLIEEVINTPTKLEASVEYDFEQPQYQNLRGPNFNIDLDNQYSYPGEFLSKTDIDNLITPTSKLNKILNDKQVRISIDHSNYSDFIHFSSAEERFRNFSYKLELIETSEDVEKSNLIKTFDHYEEFLYFGTGSSSWPKDPSDDFSPYETDSVEGIAFFNQQLSKAVIFDENNIHRLLNTIPSFLKEDENNLPYNLFIDMIGQHFDNLWLYAKNLSKKYDADNRLDYGISKDVVADALRNFGIKLYSSKVNIEDVFNLIIGDDSLYVTPPSGQTYITGSTPTPLDTYQKEIYKRIYHNLPLLLKSKGTERGLRALINCFGIPTSTLPIRYYGGVNTQLTPLLGPLYSTTSSIDKIRLDNTGSETPGNTLSYYTSIVKNNEKYTQDIGIVDIGFSPTDNINNFIIQDVISSDFNIDEYVGDPGQRYQNKYPDLVNFATENLLPALDSPYNLYDFVRQVGFFDNSLFKIIEDFVPAKANVSTGIVIKPHILERSKIKEPQLTWEKQFRITQESSSLDFTGSEYVSNFILQGDIEVGDIEGTDGLDLLTTDIQTVYTSSILLESGQTIPIVVKDAAFSGEYENSILLVTNGELNDTNIFKLQRQSSSNFLRSDFFTLVNNVEEYVPNYDEERRLLRVYGGSKLFDESIVDIGEKVIIKNVTLNLIPFKGYAYSKASTSVNNIIRSISEGLDRLGTPEDLYFSTSKEAIILALNPIPSDDPLAGTYITVSDNPNKTFSESSCNGQFDIDGEVTVEILDSTGELLDLNTVPEGVSLEVNLIFKVFSNITGTTIEEVITFQVTQNTTLYTYTSIVFDNNCNYTDRRWDRALLLIDGEATSGTTTPSSDLLLSSGDESVIRKKTVMYENKSEGSDVVRLPNSLILDSTTRLVFSTDRFGRVEEVYNKLADIQTTNPVTPTPSSTPGLSLTPTPTPTPTPTLPSYYQYTSARPEGEGNETDTSPEEICEQTGTTTSIYTNVSTLQGLTNGSILYSNSSLTSPWVGEDEWYLLSDGEDNRGVRINNSGEITDTDSIC